VLGVLLTCCVTLAVAAACTAQKIGACAALVCGTDAHTHSSLPEEGCQVCHYPFGWHFPSAADSSFYTKIIDWVFLVRKMRLCC